MDELEIDVNEVINDLAVQVAQLTSENAVLKAQINALRRKLSDGEETNGS